MKKARFTKIFGLAILVCAIVSATLAVSAFADEETRPEIIAQNVAYEGDFALMFAVDAQTAEAPVSLYLYTEVPNESSVAHKKYVVEDITAASGNLDIDSYIFKTEGVAAKDMADVFYVQAVDNNGNKSDVVRYSVAEYLYERLATPGITAAQENLYYQTLYFGAAAQSVLAPETTPVTGFRYVKVIDGLLPDGYNSGIFEIGTEITPVNESAASWIVTSYDDEKNPTVKNIKNGESFVLEGVTIVQYSNVELLPDGTIDFEGSTTLPAGISSQLTSSGASVGVVSTTRGGKTTNALQFTSRTHTATEYVRLKPAATVVDEDYDTIIFDMDVNFGTSGNYELIIRDTAGTMIFNFALGPNGSYFKLGDNTNTATGYNFWSVNEFSPVNDWVNLRFEFTPDAYTKMVRFAVYYGDKAIATGIDKGGKYFTKDNIFYTVDQIASIDFRASSATDNTMYVDNLLVKKVKLGLSPVGTLNYENDSASQTVNGVAKDTVYGTESNVYKFAPSGQVTKTFSANGLVAAADADVFAFQADIKLSNGTNTNNAAFDFMWDASEAIYWLRFDISSGKVRVYNNNDSSEEKIILGNTDEYIKFRAVFKDNAVHIFVNENYVGSFVKSRNSLTANASEIKSIRIRSMSAHTDQGVYLDNLFVGHAYEN